MKVNSLNRCLSYGRKVKTNFLFIHNAKETFSRYLELGVLILPENFTSSVRF
jgi:hypothetical protein